MAALIARGVDIGTNATNMTRQAHDQKDDVILAALVGVIKQSVLDMLDIQYKRMVEAGLPKAAAACLKRKHTDLSAVVDEQQQTFVHKCAAEVHISCASSFCRWEYQSMRLIKVATLRYIPLPSQEIWMLPRHCASMEQT